MRALLRWLRSPIAAIGLTAALLSSLWWVSTREMHGSAIGRRVSIFTQVHVLSRWNSGRIKLGSPRGSWLLIATPWVNDGGEWKPFEPNAEVFGDTPMPEYFRTLPRVDVSMSGGKKSAGFYAITRDQEAVCISMTHVAGTAPTNAELMRLRAAYVAASERAARAFNSVDDRVLKHLASSDVVTVHRRYWRGYAHNAAVIVGLAAMLYSVWFNRTPRQWKRRRSEDRLRRGECPVCRYSVEGLVERKCPECGEEWEDKRQTAKEEGREDGDGTC